MTTFSRIGIAREEQWIVRGARVPEIVVLDAVAAALDHMNVAGLSASIQEISSGRLGALVGSTRDFLIVRFGSRFPEHLVLVGCKELGNAGLGITFVLAVQQSFRRQVVRLVRGVAHPDLRDIVGSELTTIERFDLAAQVALVRQAVVDTIEEFHGTDSSQADWFAGLSQTLDAPTQEP